MMENVEQPCFVQRIEMKGFDGTVIGEEVEHREKDEKTPSAVEIAGKDRQYRKVDKKCGQIDLL